ncbi:hypothetical protein ASD30_18700 [Nocardioides sp. Root140]|nr:hypothetical protein ASD30_18700 [Nocardioides sp. Root140]
MAAKLDPASVAHRRAKAEKDRRVTIRPAPDTMTYLTGHLPVGQGVEVYAALKRAADTLIASGDERSRAQIMADTLVERVTGKADAPAVPVMINLVVSDQTLLGTSHDPAHLDGHGTIPPRRPGPPSGRDQPGSRSQDGIADLVAQGVRLTPRRPHGDGLEGPDRPPGTRHPHPHQR